MLGVMACLGTNEKVTENSTVVAVALKEQQVFTPHKFWSLLLHSNLSQEQYSKDCSSFQCGTVLLFYAS